MLAVVVKGRGIVRWKVDGVRKVVPFPAAGDGRAFMDAVDDLLHAHRPLSPIEQAALLVEHFPGAQLHEVGGTSAPTMRPNAERRRDGRSRSL